MSCVTSRQFLLNIRINPGKITVVHSYGCKGKTFNLPLVSLVAIQTAFCLFKKLALCLKDHVIKMCYQLHGWKSVAKKVI